MNPLQKKRSGFFYKQLIAIVGINILTLFIMSGLLFSNFIAAYEDNLKEVMRSKITLLAATSASALVFGDQESAATLLSSLKEHTATRYVQMYNADQQLFAEYRRSGQLVDVDIDDYESDAFFKNKNIYLSQPILMNGEYLGVIVISADTNSLNEQKNRYILIASTVLFISLVLAYLLNWQLQKRLTAPISDLINLVSYVAKNKKYHRRLDSAKDDEIGDLTLGVNTMLDTIEAHETQLFQRANYDELTQLPNRHLLMERLTHGINTATRNKTEIALLFLDLDRFKVVNDSLGHRVGDELLVQVAGKLVNTLRKSDSISRWGGDEFVMLLENIKDVEDIDNIVEKIVEELAKPTMTGGHLLHVSTSIGIARFPQDGDDSVSLLKHADISMYRAKAQGPGKFEYFNPTMLNDSVKRLTLEVTVHEAFEKKDFFMVYQPQVAVASGNVVGLEALIRWNFDGSFVPPDEFLPVIEEVGLMHDLSLWVLEQACQQNVDWQNAGFPPVSIAVNLPPSFILHVDCTEKVQSILRKTGLAAKYLEIELTENTFIGSGLAAVSVLKSLRDIGVIIALDDFGTGYSCLSYLKDLPIGTLKIDGSFIQGLGVSQANDGIVQSIITLGKSLGMTLVAECVETEQQRSLLEHMECDIIQGYLYSKPLSAADAASFLMAQSID
jgi:diguanylate cyclase (GGDEF)-like protein|tara:strand:+ start:1829 stop:3838 length:2010 start_codon:yes stop_codon:yes gene_type:complete